MSVEGGEPLPTTAGVRLLWSASFTDSQNPAVLVYQHAVRADITHRFRDTLAHKLTFCPSSRRHALLCWASAISAILVASVIAKSEDADLLLEARWASQLGWTNDIDKCLWPGVTCTYTDFAL